MIPKENTWKGEGRLTFSVVLFIQTRQKEQTGDTVVASTLHGVFFALGSTQGLLQLDLIIVVLLYN